MDGTNGATGDKATCIRSINLMATGTVDQMAEVCTPDVHTRESKDEPPATRGGGPQAMYTTLWLREAYSDLRWADRDDLGMGEQLGWTPPTPIHLARMLLAWRRARRKANG